MSYQTKKKKKRIEKKRKSSRLSSNQIEIYKVTRDLTVVSGSSQIMDKPNTGTSC